MGIRQVNGAKHSNIATSSEPDRDYAWYAVYTAFRSEKQVAAHLFRKNIHVYLPLITKSRRYVRKIKTYKVPMIGCYLFVYIQRQQYIEVLETERVVKFIKNGKEPARIKSTEIDLLRRIEGAEMEVESHPGILSEGDEVELSQGNLIGLKGRLIKRQARKAS
ncbi:MAG: hypothetical protein IPN29_03855 [Saprospiraceae bacterium]|nr:hypothetical protein [Saprospiraceae bacterium]